MEPPVDAIYLNKRGSQSDEDWVYYRVTSQGKEGDHIEVCLVSWPSFADIDRVGDEQRAVVVNPGDTGFTCAYPNICALLKNKWNVDHCDDDLIGIRVRNA